MAQLKFSYFPIATKAAIGRRCEMYVIWEFEKDNRKLLKMWANPSKTPVKELLLLIYRYFEGFLGRFLLFLFLRNSSRLLLPLPAAVFTFHNSRYKKFVHRVSKVI